MGDMADYINEDYGPDPDGGGGSSMNEKLLAHWIKLGYAVADIGDGGWGWTPLGKKVIPPLQRIILSNILFGQNQSKHDAHYLEKFDIDKDGYFLNDE